MKQELVPALMDIDARIAVKDGHVEKKPHGHGDVHALLHQHGLPAKWAKEGREWLLLFQDTNPLPFRSLCAILGVSVSRGFAMNSVAVPRLPGEAVGGICQLSYGADVNPDQVYQQQEQFIRKGASGDDLTINVEYNQLDPLLKDTPAGGDVADASGFSPYPGNINVLVFHVGTMAQRLATTGGIVPEFVNPKWADAEKSKFKSPTRLECMMQDFPRLCTKARCGKTWMWKVHALAVNPACHSVWL
ncbi:USP [Symbiodinium sp. CCMP2456]|nr:USP [Symbiodinium sp. CCMP2456]